MKSKWLGEYFLKFIAKSSRVMKNADSFVLRWSLGVCIFN